MKKILILTMVSLITINAIGQIPRITYDVNIKVIDNCSILDNQGVFDVVLSQIQKSENEYRRIYFIHGLGGNQSSMEKISEACSNANLNIDGFPPRKCYTSLLDYTCCVTGNLIWAADHIKSEILSQSQQDILDNMDPHDAILIAHSQGGMVCRTLLHEDFIVDPGDTLSFGRGYGGLVTISSPLQGAMILNNRQSIINMSNDACQSLSKAWNYMIAYNVFGQPTGTMCNVLTNDLLPAFASTYFDAITNDYKVGASWINVLNSDIANVDYCNMPKVAFYGVEPQNNLLWRTVNYMVNNPNDYNYFGANEDFTFYNNTVKPIYNVYNISYNLYKNTADNALARAKKYWYLPTITLTNLTIYATATVEKYRWQAGKKWFDNANIQWEAVIGAKKISEGKYDESDGVVVSKSAKDLPCATNTSVRIYPDASETQKGSSHMQIRNDRGIRVALKNLFDGQYGAFYLTDEQ